MNIRNKINKILKSRDKIRAKAVEMGLSTVKEYATAENAELAVGTELNNGVVSSDADAAVVTFRIRNNEETRLEIYDVTNSNIMDVVSATLKTPMGISRAIVDYEIAQDEGISCGMGYEKDFQASITEADGNPYVGEYLYLTLSVQRDAPFEPVSFGVSIIQGGDISTNAKLEDCATALNSVEVYGNKSFDVSAGASKALNGYYKNCTVTTNSTELEAKLALI